jgi:hypothetical protein
MVDTVRGSFFLVEVFVIVVIVSDEPLSFFS